MPDDGSWAERVREALRRLYDPPRLASTALGAELVRCGAARSSAGLSDVLLGMIEQLRPPSGAPQRSLGWRRYRYLTLRYVDCLTHESAAADLRISVRQATRVHHEALDALSARLFPEPAPGPSASGQPRSERARSDAPPAPSQLESALAVVARFPPEARIDLPGVIQMVCDTVRGVASDHGVVLRADLPRRIAPVMVNRIALRQILLNLLLYLIRGARGGSIQVRLRETGGGVEIAMRYRGGGAIAPADADRAALLAAARHLARSQHAVAEWVEDASGTTLRLRVARGRRTVLVIDDNPDVGDLFERLLQGSPYAPIHVRTAARALRTATESPPDAIVLDVVMPTRDGLEVLQELKSNQATQRIPVVVCSILPERDVAISLGAADFVAKPFTRKTVLTALDGLWG